MQCTNGADEFRVVILYDRLASVGPAMAAYSQLTVGLNSSFATGLRLWRTDVANLPECVAESNGDIEAANLVIVAVRKTDSAQHEAGDPGAGGDSCPVAAALGRTNGEVPSPGAWSHILRGANDNTRMDIFLWVPWLIQAPGRPGLPSTEIEKREPEPAEVGDGALVQFAMAGSRSSQPEREAVYSGVHGARLFRVNRLEGCGPYWEAEVMLGARPVGRRFASEIHARAWLAGTELPVSTSNPFDHEEMNGRFRSASFVH